MSLRRRRAAALLSVVSLTAAALLSAIAARACDTPVYLYSLQRWERDPYLVVYFFKGTEDPADAEVNELLGAIAMGDRGDANVLFRKIDMAETDPGQLRGFVRRAWEKHEADGTPFHAVMTPHGGELFAGRLDLPSVEALVKSPKRAELAEQLCAPKQGVLLLLTGFDDQENEAARDVISGAVLAASKEDLDVGVITVRRDDPREVWFVRQLLQIEDDLNQFDAPMVFGVFGRGRALEPCIGEGINEDNLTQLVRFVVGPCACEIKVQNPGMDLLTDWNWQQRIAEMGGVDAPPVRSSLYDILIVEAPSADDQDADAEAGAAPEGEGDSEAAALPETTASAEQPKPEAAPPITEAKAEGEATSPSVDEQEPKPATPTESEAAEGPPREPAAVVAALEGSEAEEAATVAAPAETEKPVSRVPEFVKSPPPPRPEPVVEEGPSLGSLLWLRLGLPIGAAVVILLAVGIFIARAKRGT